MHIPLDKALIELLTIVKDLVISHEAHRKEMKLLLSQQPVIKKMTADDVGVRVETTTKVTPKSIKGEKENV